MKFFVGFNFSKLFCKSLCHLSWNGKISVSVNDVIVIQYKKNVSELSFVLLRYPRDDWSFVFGEASFRKKSGVFSFYRYLPEPIVILLQKEKRNVLIVRSSFMLRHFWIK